MGPGFWLRSLALWENILEVSGLLGDERSLCKKGCWSGTIAWRLRVPRRAKTRKPLEVPVRVGKCFGNCPLVAGAEFGGVAAGVAPVDAFHLIIAAISGAKPFGMNLDLNLSKHFPGPRDILKGRDNASSKVSCVERHRYKPKPVFASGRRMCCWQCFGLPGPETWTPPRFCIPLEIWTLSSSIRCLVQKRQETTNLHTTDPATDTTSACKNMAQQIACHPSCSGVAGHPPLLRWACGRPTNPSWGFDARKLCMPAKSPPATVSCINHLWTASHQCRASCTLSRFFV